MHKYRSILKGKGLTEYRNNRGLNTYLVKLFGGIFDILTKAILVLSKSSYLAASELVSGSSCSRQISNPEYCASGTHPIEVPCHSQVL